MLIIAILAFCVIRGVFRGLIKEMSSIIGVLAGFYAAYSYYTVIANLLSRWISSAAYLNILSFLILFCGVFFIISILGVIIKYVLDIAFMGCVDNNDIFIGRGQLRDDEMKERIFLRLTQRGTHVEAFCSVDGKQWWTVGLVEFPVSNSMQVGVHAIGEIDRTIYHGAYPDGTAIRFTEFKMWRL